MKVDLPGLGHCGDCRFGVRSGAGLENPDFLLDEYKDYFEKHPDQWACFLYPPKGICDATLVPSTMSCGQWQSREG